MKLNSCGKALAPLVAILSLISACGSDRAQRFDADDYFGTTSSVELKGANEPAPVATSTRRDWLLVDFLSTLTLAGAHDLEIARAATIIDELQANRSLAETNFFPKLLPGISFRRRTGQSVNTPGRFLDVTLQETRAGARARLELQLGDAIYDLDAADLSLASGQQSLRVQRHASSMKAAKRYFDLVAAVQEIEIAREAQAFAIELLRYRESLVKQGAGLKAEEEKARARVEEEATAVAIAEQRLREVSGSLALQLRIDPRVMIYPKEDQLTVVQLTPSNVDVEELILRAMATNPTLALATARLMEAEGDLDRAQWSWLYPTVVLEGSVDQRGEDPSRFGGGDFFAAGLEWQISLGQGAMKRAASARRDRAAIDRAMAHERTVSFLVTTMDRRNLIERRIKSSERRIVAARAALSLTEAKMKNGVGLLLEVLDARVDLTEAMLARLRAISDFNKNEVTLLVLSGLSPANPGGMKR